VDRTDVRIVDDHVIAVGAAHLDGKSINPNPFRDVAFGVENFDIA